MNIKEKRIEEYKKFIENYPMVKFGYVEVVRDYSVIENCIEDKGWVVQLPH